MSERGLLCEPSRGFILRRGSHPSVLVQQIKGDSLRGGYSASANQGESGEEYGAGIHNLTTNEGYEGRRTLSQNQWELRDRTNDSEGCEFTS